MAGTRENSPGRPSPQTPDTIVDERCCIHCGYSLRGLRIDGVCPECGRPIKGRKRAPRYTDQLVHAPMAWLQVFATGAVLMLFAAAGVLAMIVTLLFVWTVPLLLVLAGLCAAWAVGVWLCTRPRPELPRSTVNVHAEWRTLRVAARTTQCFWPLTVLLALFCVWIFNNSLSTVALYTAIGTTSLSLLIAVGGLAPTCALLANIADWAEDSSLAQSLRGCAWTICFCGVVLGLSVLNIYTHVLGSFIGGLLATFIVAMVFMPPAYFLYCLFKMQSMARWAIWNHVAAEAKLDRFRASAAAAARRSRGASGPQHLPPRER